MSYTQKYKKDELVEQSKEVKETVKDILTFPYMDFPERNIRKDTMERFGVRVGLSQENGKDIQYIYFPSYNQKGKVVGYMRQDLSKGKEEKGHWQAIGSVTIGNKLFGQDVVESISRKRNNFIVTEGQWDALSAYQALVDNVKNTKYEGMEPFVVSIPLGTKNAVEAILHNIEFVKSFDGVTFFFDEDECTPQERLKGMMKGREAREAAAGALVGSGLKLFTVNPAEGFKDASDYMQAGMSTELAKLLQFDKKAFSAENIIHAGDISFDELVAPRPEGINIPEFPKLMQKIHGLRSSEFIILTSPSGVGKSTTSAIFAKTLRAAGEKVGMIFLEEQVKETIQRFVAAELKVNYLRFKNAPLHCVQEYGMDADDIRSARDRVIADDGLVLLNHFGSMPIDTLMAKIKHMHFVEGCRFIFLDHISLVLSGSRVADERKELDIVCTELAAFCAANDCTVLAVSHINRSGADQFRPPKGQEDQPYWVRVTKESLRGSAALEQLAFIILGLEPEINPDRSRGRVRWVVLKNRPWSYLGEGDTFTIDEDTWDVLLSDMTTTDF